ncbi:MAG: hypothetical protein ACKOC5_09965 [Chloroflexota bacterium]
MNTPHTPPPAGPPDHPAQAPTPHAHPKRKKNRRRGCLAAGLALLFVITLAGVVALGALAGKRSGEQSRLAVATELAGMSLQEQYDLAVQDLAGQRYDIARQRLEYILAIDPGYPGVVDRLAEAQAILFATATPTTAPPTLTLTPTRDLRPVQDLFAQAEQLWRSAQWSEAIDTLLALRQNDSAYQTARVDGMMFIALRQRGVDKIWKSGDLVGGMYDLALAARFGPLDYQALSARDLARLYQTGTGFYGVYPEEAIKYFSQVAAAAPGLRDASGVTASQRYRDSLIQYGDKLMGENSPCEAAEQYQLAATVAGEGGVDEKLAEAQLACNPPTKTPGAPTNTPSITPPGAPTATPTTPVVVPPTVTSGPPSVTPTTPVAIPPTNTVAPEPPTNTPAPPTNTAPPPEPPTNTPEPPAPEASPTTGGI